jgi:hypothetical protein
MYKKVFLLTLIASVLIAVAGCGGGGATVDSGGGNTAVQTAIASALTGFNTAVDNYDVTGMLSYLAKGNGFQLTISEVGYSYTKTYEQLKKELNDVATDQLNWRKAPPDGHGYQLNLILSSLQNFSNVTDTGGIASQTFVVKEMAVDPPISWTQTDSGTITWQVAKIDGVWKVIAMTIAYNNNTNSMAVQSSSSPVLKFGFGHFNGHNL